MSTAAAAAVSPLPPGGTIGLVAGWGDYPRQIARALREQGHRVACLAVLDHADPTLADECDDFTWVGLAQLGRAIRYFRQQGVRQATMAGKIHKVVFYQPGVWFRHRPDLRTLRCFWGHFVLSRKDRKDDTLLLAVVNEFARDGIQFAPATDFAPELLIGRGPLTTKRPSSAQWKDIEFGWRLAKEMGRLDVGQSVAVKDRAALAVEAIEGTDECIRRAGALCARGGFTLVKVAKPQQDMRFDVPTIGLGTLRTLAAAGAGVLAIEAGRTIVLDRDEVVRFADEHGVAIVAVDDVSQAIA